MALLLAVLFLCTKFWRRDSIEGEQTTRVSPIADSFRLFANYLVRFRETMQLCNGAVWSHKLFRIVSFHVGACNGFKGGICAMFNKIKINCYKAFPVLVVYDNGLCLPVDSL